MEKMPSKGLYLTMVIVGFFLGILWGALSISPYQKMKAAIDAGDSVTAWDNAKKIRTLPLDRRSRQRADHHRPDGRRLIPGQSRKQDRAFAPLSCFLF